MKHLWIIFVYWLFKKAWFPLLLDTKRLAIHLSEIELYRQAHGIRGDDPKNDYDPWADEEWNNWNRTDAK